MGLMIDWEVLRNPFRVHGTLYSSIFAFSLVLSSIMGNHANTGVERPRATRKGLGLLGEVITGVLNDTSGSIYPVITA